MLERHHLEILRQVKNHGSLTAAANQLCLTQSALSHTIKKLEHQLGTQVWFKEGRQIRLTAVGEHLLTTANRLLPLFEYAEHVVQQMAAGERGLVRLGMECHPCYQWLMKVVAQYLKHRPGVDIDVKQRFQFGGMNALFNYEIDLLVTPDPLQHKGVRFLPVFDYEQVLVVSQNHPFSKKRFVKPSDLSSQTLYTYPVEIDRLDIFTQFLLPKNCRPKKHKQIEATQMMLQLVAAERGVATLPMWLVKEYMATLPITAVRLGELGINKQIHLGVRTRGPDQSLANDFIEFSAAF
ncbi:MAG: LysR family transcriptional regulator [Arenicella sp.]|nr:LysR family transcriptional regulator [Arenicella sp.]